MICSRLCVLGDLERCPEEAGKIVRNDLVTTSLCMLECLIYMRMQICYFAAFSFISDRYVVVDLTVCLFLARGGA